MHCLKFTYKHVIFSANRAASIMCESICWKIDFDVCSLGDRGDTVEGLSRCPLHASLQLLRHRVPLASCVSAHVEPEVTSTTTDERL